MERELIAEDMGLQFCHLTNSYSCELGTKCKDCEFDKEYEKALDECYGSYEEEGEE